MSDFFAFYEEKSLQEIMNEAKDLLFYANCRGSFTLF